MRALFVLALAVCSTTVPAAAQENDDLARIPGAVSAAPSSPSPPAATHGKYSVEDAFGWSFYRGTLAVPLPSAAPSRWANRTSVDVLDQWTLAPGLTASFSDRLSVSFADGVGFSNEAVRNDPREAYLTWEVAPQTYLEAGRINIRNGVAYGYNPTDFFRARTTVAQSSADPGAQRQNRLGTILLRAQHIFEGGTIDVVYAPKLHKQVAIGTVGGPFDPRIDQTNGTDRVLVSLSFELEELSPQVLVFHDSGRTTFGVNVSHPVGNSVIAYASWTGGNMPSAVVDAIGFGKRTGTIPAFVPLLPPTSAARRFQNDLSAGAYWTGEDKETLSIEYNFHQAGFSKSDWRNWFSIGTNPTYSSLMWYLRGYASDQQQPMSAHQMFARADWAEPFQVEHFDINAFVMTDLMDGSAIGQFGAFYDLSDHWSFGGYVSGNLGGRRSAWGSLRSDASAIVQLVRYL